MSKIRETGAILREHLAEISTLFVAGTKLTLLARQPSHPDGSRDMVVTDDTFPEVIAALTLRETAARGGG